MNGTSICRVALRAALMGFGVAGIAAPIGAMAQGGAASAGAGGAQLEEIIVSARKREESLQDVPISVSAIDAQQIERLSIRDVRDVAKITPSVVFDTGFDQRDTRIIIRGLSPTRGRQNAALLIDGIDVTGETINAAGGSLLASRRLIDLERIEVVKGPQAALYGRSAFNGAVQYITRKPSVSEMRTSASVEVASDSRYSANASLSGPVVDGKLGLGINAAWYDNEGFYEAANNGQSLGGENGWGVALSAHWEASERFRIDARVEFSDDEFDPLAQVWALPNNLNIVASSVVPSAAGISSAAPQFLYFGAVPDADQLRSPTHASNPFTGAPYDGAFRDGLRGSLIAQWDLGRGSVTSWTGFANANSGVNQSADNGEGVFSGPVGAQTDLSMNAGYRFVDTDTKLLSQELRFQSDLDGAFQFTIGGLYWLSQDEQASRNMTRTQCTRTQLVCTSQTGAQALRSTVNATDDNDLWEREIRHYSIYGVVEFEFSEAWKLTAEARFAREEEDLTGPVCADADYFYRNGIIDANSPINRLRASIGLPVRIVTTAANIGNPTLGTCTFGPSSISQGATAPFVTYKGLAAPYSTSFEDDFVTPRLTLQWQPNESTNAYLSAANGVKPGGTSTITAGPWFDSNFDNDVNEVSYKPESLWSYELGLKKQWLERRVQTNFALFYQDYTDKQVGTQVITPSGTATGKIENAGEAELMGLEFEGSWRATPGLTLSASYTYLDTEYKKFSFLSTSALAVLRAGNCTPTPVRNPATGTTSNQCTIDQSGRPLERSPEHSAFFQANYERPLGGGEGGMRLLIGADARYLGERTLDPSARILLKSAWLSDARVGVVTDKWEAMLFCTNCFDSDTVISATDSSNTVTAEFLTGGTSAASVSTASVNLPDPAVFGIRASLRF